MKTVPGLAVCVPIAEHTHMIRVLYFASLGERLGTQNENLDAAGIHSAGALLERLRARGDTWDSAFGAGTVMIAVNQEMADRDTPVADGDEVAFFPPVTGG